MSQTDLVLGLLLASWDRGALCALEWQVGSWPQEVRDIVWSESLPETEPHTVRPGEE